MIMLMIPMLSLLQFVEPLATCVPASRCRSTSTKVRFNQ
jgi:hypothetical protein